VLTFTARVTVQAGKEQEFEAMMCDAVPRVREEPGNHTYIVHRAVDNPRVFMSYEEYADQAASEAHRRHLQELGVDLRAGLEGPPVLESYEKLA
jgi:quinol monooxygenase YgiN